jgi:integrase/recombinase XerD
LFKWAVESQEAPPHNPAKEVAMIATNSDGYHTWTEDEIVQFEQRHPIGTKARLAMALMLYTTGRREDATRFGPQHVRGSRIVYTQAKNEHRKPVHMDIPVHPELKRIIDATLSGHLTFLVTQFGKPFRPAGFGNWFADRCKEAGVPGRAHGLRKATATRLAEAGATPHMIQGLTGHRTLKEVEVYTRKAQQKLLADAAMEKLIANKNPPTDISSGRKTPKSA